VKKRDLERHLRQEGCRLDRQGAKHERWEHTSSGATTSVKRQREIGPGMVRKICRDLGIAAPANVS